MSSSEQIHDLYDKIRLRFFEPVLLREEGRIPKLVLKENILYSQFLNDLMQSCVELYNQIDTVVETLKLTVPAVHKELEKLIATKVIGELNESQHEFVKFNKPELHDRRGTVSYPSPDKLPHGIKPVITLLTKAFESAETSWHVLADECYFTALLIFGTLKASLTQLLTRFDYVMMFPHRIVLDRVILETGFKKHGLDRVVGYIQSAEEHFNKQKYIEFCAMSRNALHEAVKNVCLIIDGAESDFSTNYKRLEEMGFFKSTILKQMKEFSGSLSACGSHPPKEELLSEEAKFLLDSLYGFLGLISLRLSSFKRQTSSQKRK